MNNEECYQIVAADGGNQSKSLDFQGVPALRNSFPFDGGWGFTRGAGRPDTASGAGSRRS